MKNYINIFVLLKLLVLGSACNNQPEIPLITPANMSEDKLTLADIAEEVSYIKLDTSLLLSDISDVKKSQNGYFIRSDNGLFLFGNDGKFKRQIGKKGKGPQEYSWIRDFAFDKNSELIYLINQKNVMVFTSSGEFKVTFPTPGEFTLSNIYFYNSRLYFPKGFGFGGLKTEWFETDTNGSVIREKNNYIKNVEPSVEYSPNLMFRNDNGLYYWNQLNDTIFNIGIEITPAYLFARDRFRVTANDLASEDNCRKKASWQTMSILGTNHYLIFDYLLQRDEKEVYTIYDTDKQKMYEWSVLENFEAKGVNTFDNGVLFLPKARAKYENAEYLISWVDAFALKAQINSDEFKNSTPLYPEKKKELEQLANSLDENDNPVLMLVKLKE